MKREVQWGPRGLPVLSDGWANENKQTNRQTEMCVFIYEVNKNHCECVLERESQMDEVEWLVIDGDVLLRRLDANPLTDLSSPPSSLLTISNVSIVTNLWFATFLWLMGKFSERWWVRPHLDRWGWELAARGIMTQLVEEMQQSQKWKKMKCDLL